jgi:hypothetical protein
MVYGTIRLSISPTSSISRPPGSSCGYMMTSSIRRLTAVWIGFSYTGKVDEAQVVARRHSHCADRPARHSAWPPQRPQSTGPVTCPIWVSSSAWPFDSALSGAVAGGLFLPAHLLIRVIRWAPGQH